MHWQHNTHPHNSNNTLQPCQHLVPPLNITIKTNQLSSQNHRNGPGEENSLACAMLNTSRKKQIYEASNEGSGRAGVWGGADTSAGPGPLTLTCKLHPHHSPAHDALSSIRGKSSRERGSQLHRQHQSGLEYRSKMPIISKLNLLLWIIPSGEIIIFLIDLSTLSQWQWMRSVRFWGLSGLPEIRDLIIRQVPVNQEMMFWEDVSQDTVSHNYIVRSVHKEEGVTWDCGAIWFRYENIIIDNGPPESWSCSVTHFRVLPSRSSELHIGCNVMITASLTRRHNDACYETWRPDNFTSHPRHSRHRPGQSITAFMSVIKKQRWLHDISSEMSTHSYINVIIRFYMKITWVNISVVQ